MIRRLRQSCGQAKLVCSATFLSASLSVALLVALVVAILHAAFPASALAGSSFSEQLVPAPPAMVELAPGFVSVPGNESVMAVVTVDGLDPQAQTASLQIQLTVPPNLVATLATPVSASEPAAIESYAHVVVTATTDTVGGSPTAIFDSALNPNAFGDPRVETSASTQLSIPAAPLGSSNVTDFPLDSYTLDLVMQIFLPDDRRFTLGQRQIAELPIDAFVSESNTFTDFTTTAVVDSQAFLSANSGWGVLYDRNRATMATVELSFARSGSQWILTLATGSLPLLLVALFGAILFADIRKQIGRVAELDFLIGIAASLLAILPLRATLIPTAIQSRTLTLLDLFLAFQASLFVLVACIHTWRWLTRGQSQGVSP